jgi:hypothetical protein
VIGLTPDIRWRGGSMAPTVRLDIEPQILCLPERKYYFLFLNWEIAVMLGSWIPKKRSASSILLRY